MAPKELFAVGVRLIGLASVMVTIPDLFSLNYLAFAPAVAGLILITRADLIANLCYPKELTRGNFEIRAVPRDFRDT